MKFKLFNRIRSRVWHRLAVVVAIMVAAMSIAVLEAYTVQQADIEFAESEDRGISYLLPFQRVIRAIATHRGIAALYLGGRTDMQNELRTQTNAVDAAIVEMDKAEAEFGETFDRNDLWGTIKREWAQLKTDLSGMSAAQSIERHNEIVEQGFAKNTDVLTDSNLILDPVAESYFLMDLSLVKLFDLTNKASELRETAVAVVASGSMSLQQQVEFAGLEALLAEEVGVVDDDFAQAVKNDPALRQELEPSFNSFHEGIEKALADMDRVEQEAQDQRTFTVSAEALNEDITEAIAAVSEFEDQTSAKLQELLRERIADSERTQFLYVAGGAAVALLALWVALLATRNITGPLSILADVSRRVASGDTAARAQIARADEIGELAMQFDIMVDQQVATAAKIRAESEQINNSIIALLQGAAKLSQKDLTAKVPVAEDVTGAISDALNAMAEETSKVLGEVVSVAQQTAMSAQEVKSQSNSIMDVASTERKVVQQAAEQLDQASQRMTQVAALANQCNDAARVAIASTERAQGTVLGTVQGIAAIRETIRETEKRIKRLGERSQEISGVVNLINTIAERTHILALNASMHAASAGEAGRGFAVVANEVQRLAENAREATSKISSLVSNIQVETADTVVTMNDAISKVVSGTELAERAGVDMKSTRETTAGLVQLVEQIAIQSQNQAKVTLALREQAADIVRSTSQTYDQLDAQRGHTDLLVEYSDALLTSVNVFTLPSREVKAPVVRPIASAKSAPRRAAANG